MIEADPEDYNAPLTRWGHVWRTVLCLAISTTAWWEIAGNQWTEDRAWFWIDLACGLASFVLVFYRRRWPFGIALVLNLFGLVSMSTAGPACLAMVSLATRRKLPGIVVVGAVGIVTGQLYTYYQPAYDNQDPPWVNFTVLVAFTIALSVFGMYVGSRRELLWTLRERARQAESTQELRVDQARSAERERIAREMHDVLAHRMSLVTMHAGALAYRTDLPPEQVRETAQLIQEKAHEALADLRQVLGVLRDDTGVGDRPQPTLADLDCLLTEARESGIQVDLNDGLGGSAPGEQTGRTLYRIIQEGLTNARKHAPGTRVTVSLDGDPASGVTVIVRNGKPVGSSRRPLAPPSGLGLVGLRERAALAGGTLDVDDTLDGFRLRGWLPWTPGTST